VTGRQLRQVLSRKDVADIAIGGAMNRCNRPNQDLGICLVGKLRPKMVSQLSKADPIVGRKKAIMFHQQLQNGVEPAILVCRYQNWLAMPNRNC
jgi:hypothetical protein